MILNSTVQLAKKAIPSRHRWLLRARRSQGSWFLRSPDRLLLEKTIIPYFAGRPSVAAVLDVGCDWYTAGYPKLFPQQRYCSIDIDPAKADIAKGKHRTASLLDLDECFDAESFDLVMVNGVFGWGVDGEGPISTAMAQLRRVLRPGGYLLVGWNDTDERRPQPLGSMLEAPGFAPFEMPAFAAVSKTTDTAYRHTFHFFR